MEFAEEDKKGGDLMIGDITTDIKSLSQNRPLITSEIDKLNDSYGHAFILKKYAGIKEEYQIKGVLEHSVMLMDQVWLGDLSIPLPVHFTFSSYRFSYLRQFTNKALFAIGPSIHYAAPQFSREEINQMREALGNTLLVFLPHSSIQILVEFHHDRILPYLKRFEKEYENILICIGWRDVQRGIDAPYKAEGYTCVTAGHVFDRNFLPRLKSLIMLSSHTMSFGFGTHVGFCIHLGKPHWISPIEMPVSAPDKISKTAMYHGTPLGVGQGKYFIKFFREPRDDISPEQKDLVELWWGCNEVRNPAGLRELFSIAEDMFKRGYLPSDKATPLMLRQSFEYIREEKEENLKTLFKEARKIGFHPFWQRYLKAVMAWKKGDIERASVLIEEIKANGSLKKYTNILLEEIRQGESYSFITAEGILDLYPRPKFFAKKKTNLPWR